MIVKFKFRQIFILAGCILCAILIFTKNEYANKGVANGLLLCSSVIIPALFPFMSLSSFIIKSGLTQFLSVLFNPVTKLLFGLPGSAGIPIIMSYIGGYPVGAKSVSTLYENGTVTKSEAHKMLYFCVNASPAFVILAVGAGLLKSMQAGILLLVAHIVSSILLGVLCNILIKPHVSNVKKSSEVQKPTSLMDAFVEATAESCSALLIVCGFTILFSVILTVVNSFNLWRPIEQLTCGILEVTNGCVYASNAGYLPYVAAIIGFGGLSVHFQVFATAGKARPHYFLFLLARITQALLSALIMLPLQSFFPVAKDVLTNNVKPLPVFVSYSLPASVALLFMCAVFLFTITNKTKNTPTGFFEKNVI